jgi:hypothetical protein
VNRHHLLVEVKTLEPNNEERLILARRACGEVVAGGGTPGERLRRELRSANAQLRPLAAGRQIPTLLVVLNNTDCKIHTHSYSVMTAMQGLDVIDVQVPADPSVLPVFGRVHSGPERAMRRDANTSTSGVAILREVGAEDIRLDVYHNRFAAVPLDPNGLRIAGVTQFRLPDGAANSIEASWMKVYPALPEKPAIA